MIIICLYACVWFQVFLSNTNFYIQLNDELNYHDQKIQQTPKHNIAGALIVTNTLGQSGSRCNAN